jgi:hypothetical protein
LKKKRSKNKKDIEQVEVETQTSDTGGQPLRRSRRIAAGVNPPECYAHASFVERGQWKEDTAKEAIKAKIKSNCSRN